MASQDQLLSDLLPLKSLAPAIVEGLIHTAWKVVRRCDLDSLSLEEVLSLDEEPARPGESRASLVHSSFDLLPPELIALMVAPTALTGGKLAQFDVALACPPIGLRYERDLSQQDQWGRFPEQTSSGAVLAVRHFAGKGSAVDMGDRRQGPWTHLRDLSHFA